MDVAVDTNVLSDLLEHPQAAKSLEVFLFKNPSSRLIIPNSVFGEILDVEQSAKLKMLRRLGALMEKWIEQIKFGRDFVNILKEEYQHPIGRAPTVSPAVMREIRYRFLKMPDDQLLKAYAKTEFQTKNKQSFLDADRAIRSDFNKKFDKNELLALFKDYGGIAPNNVWLEFMEGKFKFDRQQILRQPDRYPCIYNYSLHEEYYAVSICIVGPEKNNLPANRKPMKHAWGAHADGRILAECTYCDVFVTLDKDATTRFSQLNDRKLIRGQLRNIVTSLCDI